MSATTPTITAERWIQTYRRHLGACVGCGHPRGQHYRDQECADCAFACASNAACQRYVS